MTRRRLAAALAALALTLGAAGTALAVIPGTLDQSHDCVATHCNTANTALYPHWYSGNGTGNNDSTGRVTLGQTFTAGRSAHLTAVSLYLAGIDGAAPPATFTVGVVATDSQGVPNLGSAIAAGSVTTADTTIATSTDPAWVTVVFATPPTVTAGHKYAIVLGLAGWQDQAWMRWALDTTVGEGAYTDYAGGEAMAATQPKSSDPWNWQTMISVLTDGGSGTADFGFRTYVAAATTPSAVPTQPPTDAATPTQTTSGGGATAVFALLAVVAVAAIILPSPVAGR